MASTKGVISSVHAAQESLHGILSGSCTALPWLVATAECAPAVKSGLGSRKRKAYMPRNSGSDDIVVTSSETPAPKKLALESCHVATLVQHTSRPAVVNSCHNNLQAETRAPSSDTSSTAAPSEPAIPASQDKGVPPLWSPAAMAPAPSPNSTLSPTVVESLAATRSRRNIKKREVYDPKTFDLSGDLEEPVESRSDGSTDTLSRKFSWRKPEQDGVHSAGTQCKPEPTSGASIMASPRSWRLSLVCSNAKTGRSSDSASGTSDEQRMFQGFRKQTCSAYTGVVVHCQNMKLEARVNMVSYLPQRERKISGGQIYIAYMTNPHQAAVVHDITASIMTAPEVAIYHNNHCRPSTNREVALERLNYLDTLEVNMHRGYSRNNDKDHVLERKARMDAESRRNIMLSPEALKKELHCWVSHDSRWMTFKSWIEEVLFDSKLANMFLKPKIIDENYLTKEERELLRKHISDCNSASPPVFTHMYDTLVMKRVESEDGKLMGYHLISKRYRRRKPELRNGTIKWNDDKSCRCDLEDAATAEDQQRVDIAWGIVQKWLRHYDPALQGPLPDYEPVDANYYVTWGHFAEWVNSLLQNLPAEIEAIHSEASAVTAERSTATRRSSRTSDSQNLKALAARLQAVYDKFRAVVAEGDKMPNSWSQATLEHRRAFENFFAGWKPLPPSMSQPQRKCAHRASASSATGDGTCRTSRRLSSVQADTAALVARQATGARVPSEALARTPSSLETTQSVPTFEEMYQRPAPSRAAQATNSSNITAPLPASISTKDPQSSRLECETNLSSVSPSKQTQLPLNGVKLEAAAIENSHSLLMPKTSPAGDQFHHLPPNNTAPGDAENAKSLLDVVQLHAWAAMHGLSCAVPPFPTSAGLGSSIQAQPANVTRTNVTPYTGSGYGTKGVHHLLQNQVTPAGIGSVPQSIVPSDAPALAGGRNQILEKASSVLAGSEHVCSVAPHQAVYNTMASLNLPQTLFLGQLAPSHGFYAASTAAHGAPTQAAPAQVFSLAQAPFLNALDRAAKASVMDVLFPNAPPVPALSGQDGENGNASANDSAKSCMTTGGGTSPPPCATSVTAPAVPTAISHPTLSNLLSNPLFAVPVAQHQALMSLGGGVAAAGSANSSPPGSS